MALRIGTDMPELSGATEWLTGNQSETASAIAGHPTLVHFWSVSCGICKENMPKVAEWREEKREAGLRVVAVHMPRYPSDTEIGPVRDALTQYGISEPCAVDNEHKLRDAFKNDQGYVPAYYLFDAQGKLKGFAAGERGISLIGPAIERLLSRGQGSGVGDQN